MMLSNNPSIMGLIGCKVRREEAKKEAKKALGRGWDGKRDRERERAGGSVFCRACYRASSSSSSFFPWFQVVLFYFPLEKVPRLNLMNWLSPKNRQVGVFATGEGEPVAQPVACMERRRWKSASSFDKDSSGESLPRNRTATPEIESLHRLFFFLILSVVLLRLLPGSKL